MVKFSSYDFWLQLLSPSIACSPATPDDGAPIGRRPMSFLTKLPRERYGTEAFAGFVGGRDFALGDGRTEMHRGAMP